MDRKVVRVHCQAEGYRFIALDKIISIYVSKDGKHAEVGFVNGETLMLENEFDIKNLIGVFSHG